ncbi:hypothetical protein FBEOM_882 [Fusarium beomiforme]|uniref:Uncharacterized protein n=1 Tax=Fusarium beomiforme TaxID=44412 RepID=A0A9P5E1L8_9HYPO|nr:hypothetical protein FBEOM_882 [Fusarium beomiforme]
MLLQLLLTLVPACLGLSVDDLSGRTYNDIGEYNNPKLRTFLWLDLAVGRETNVSSPGSLGIMAPNVKGGKATGAFEADILPLGASWEDAVIDELGENSFYKNRYILQTVNNDTIKFEVDVILNYRNNAHHGFGFGKFATDIPALLEINYNSYLVEVTGDFETGKAAGQVFALKSGGRRDGQPIKALLPPGGS